jgi:hypothetical protein
VGKRRKRRRKRRRRRKRWRRCVGRGCNNIGEISIFN